MLFAIYVNIPGNFGIPLPGQKGEFTTHLGLDLVGGVQALLEADVPSSQTIDPKNMSIAVQIIENRVNGLGVSEAIVQPAGSTRIVVELPGETDPARALATIKQTGLLEFVDMSDISVQTAASLVNTKIKTSWMSGENQPSQTGTPDISITSTSEPSSTITSTLPVETGTIFQTVMTGTNLKNVGVQTTQGGGYVVAFELNAEGTQIFKDFTSTHIGDILGIVLDKEVISIPSINTAITGGKGVIEGRFTAEEANHLAVQLKYGSLPIPLKVVTSETIGPTLGQDSLQKSLTAGVIGITVVILFMAVYYRLPGIIADLALVCYALCTYALFRLIPVTLTLPGIAGFVLSIGVAVDANVLIFERIKEELRSKKSLNQAIDLGWKRAWPSIRDSNFSTLITCMILFWFGNTFGASIVKGFSLTLALGVMVSMFTAIVVTRTFLHLVLDKINFTRHPRWFGV
jgi:preprotein translocase subunit SecD